MEKKSILCIWNKGQGSLEEVSLEVPLVMLPGLLGEFAAMADNT